MLGRRPSLTPNRYFDRESGTCRGCPEFQKRLMLPLAVIVALLALAGLVALAVRQTVKQQKGALFEIVAFARRLIVRIQQLELVPRFKLIFAC